MSERNDSEVRAAEQEICSRLTVEGHFHRLACCPKEVLWWARTREAATRWQKVIDRWIAAGRPDPGAWENAEKGMLIEPYERAWKQGKADL